LPRSDLNGNESAPAPRRGQPVVLRTAPREPVELDRAAVLLDAADDVAIAKEMLAAGTVLTTPAGPVQLAQAVPPGHKLALREVAAGAPVRRYGQTIGFATHTIAPGEHVHVHNLAVGDRALELDYAPGADTRPVEFRSEAERRNFAGFRRADGRVGTRNYVAVLASVNCSSSAARRVVQAVRESGVLSRYPNVDDVIAFPTKGGCGAHYGSSDLAQLQRTLGGVVDHPNVAAYVVLSLGCEVNQPDDLIEVAGLARDGRGPLVLTIEQDGGFQRTVEAGAEAVARLLPHANDASREPVPASELVVALQCGGSDGWSGVTANPAVGRAADEIVRQGGTVVLGETTEVYGAEHLLTRRARSPEVADKLLERIRWWERHAASFGASIDNNPAPGNKAGGLTTIYEKSLGAIAKAGSTPLNEVVGYAERITERGFVHMDTPGYDPVSVTGQVAGGCTVVVFTTGRGSCFGFKPSPTIKVASTSTLYAAQELDMDVNAGRVLEGATLEEVGREIFEQILAVASGQPTKSELAGIGEEEFNPWIVGVTL
jgi:altronate hydrolase